MTRALELLPSIGEVSVSVVPGTNLTQSWVITFLNDLGDLPMLTVTRGRVNGTNADVRVVETQRGVGAPNIQCDQVPVKNEIQTITTISQAAVVEVQRVDIFGGCFTPCPSSVSLARLSSTPASSPCTHV